MPDRFANGDTGNDAFADMQQPIVDREKVLYRHGGDLLGIMQHLDYLEKLGVTTIALNPVQENDQPYDSYHGYATTDHYAIDKRLGTNQQYRRLVQLCHARGMKVVMDIIHNHCGDQHWFIQDLPMEDWIFQSDSLRRVVYRAPVHMDPYASKADQEIVLQGWFDNHMPDLNHKNPFVANYLIQNHLWWTLFSGHDGYRIDTYVYSDQDFMAAWGRRMQEELPQMAIFGETWVHGVTVQAQFTQNNNLREGYNSYLPGCHRLPIVLWYDGNACKGQRAGPMVPYACTTYSPKTFYTKTRFATSFFWIITIWSACTRPWARISAK
jgi:glycosidase